jgi:hypothetical protein
MSMEKRDYLMVQIEQMGQALASMLAYLLGLKGTVKGGLSIEEMQQTYKDKLDLPLELMLDTPSNDLVKTLSGRDKYLEPHLDKVADILIETAHLYDSSGDKVNAMNLYRKALVILEHLQADGNAFSMDGMMKITDIKKLLD